MALSLNSSEKSGTTISALKETRRLTLLQAGGPTLTPPPGGTAGFLGQRDAPFQPVSLAVQH